MDKYTLSQVLKMLEATGTDRSQKLMIDFGGDDSTLIGTINDLGGYRYQDLERYVKILEPSDEPELYRFIIELE